MYYLLLLLSLILGLIISKIDYLIIAILIVLFIVYSIYKLKYKLKKILIFLSLFIIGLTLNLSLTSYGNNIKTVDNQIMLVTKAKENYYIVSNYISKFYVYEKGNNVDEGDILKVSGTLENLEFNMIESSFDFKSYLNSKGIFKKLNIFNKKIIYDNLFSKKDLSSIVLKNYNDDAKLILNSNFFSNKDYDNIYMNSYKNLNFTSSLSSAGIFITFAFTSIFSICNIKLSRKTSYIITLLLFLPFILYNTFSYSISRIYMLFFIKFIFEFKCNKKIDKITLMGAINIPFILLDPFVIFGSDFVFINLATYLSFELKTLNYNIFKGKYKNIFANNIIKKFIFYIFFIPISITSTNSINLVSIFIQILLLPLFKVNYLLGFFSLYFGYNPLLDFSCSLFNTIVDGCYIKTLNINIPSLNFVSLISFYILFLVFIYFLKINYQKIIKAFMTSALIISILYILPIKNILTSQISFINVGQGDAILIRHKVNNYLIDCGGLKYLDVATDSLIPYLRKNRIYSINSIFITHNDYDHSGSLDSLIDNFNVKNIISSKEMFPYFSSGLEFKNLNDIDSSDTNESSLVIYLNIYNKKFLFMGDAPKNIEENIVLNNKLEIDVLKVGHHGSNTSTSENFIKSIKPKEAVISCGKNNFYGHPHTETLNTLNKYNVKIRRTDLEGTITYYI